MMMLVSAPEQRRDMDPAVQIDRAEIYVGMKPKMGPREQTVSLIIPLISVGVILTQWPPLLKVGSLLEGTETCYLMYKTQQNSPLFRNIRG